MKASNDQHAEGDDYSIGDDLRRRNRRQIIPALISIAFISLTILVGTLLVYFTRAKSNNQICRRSFNRIKEEVTQKDSSPQDMERGYINDDYYVDFVVANAGTDTIGIFLNSGNGSLLDPIPVSVGENCQPRSVAVGFFDDNYDTDIAVACFRSNTIAILISKGKEAFYPPKFISLGQSKPVAVRVAQWNDDLIADLVVSTLGTSLILILLGNGDGSFTAAESYHMGYDADPIALIISDVNMDYRDDIVVLNKGITNLVILLSNENGTATQIEKWWDESGFVGSSITIGDVDGDYWRDILVGSSASNTICIFFGSSEGTFNRTTITQIVSEGSTTDLVFLGTSNEDLILDLAVVDNSKGNLFILKGVGQGNFELSLSYETPYAANAVKLMLDSLGDDLLPEIAILDSETNNIYIAALYNAYIDGTKYSYDVRNRSLPSAIAAGYFDSDRVLDVVVANTRLQSISVILGFHRLNTSSMIDYAIYNGSTAQALATGDVNNDDHVDIVIALTGKSAVGILLGDGTGSFGQIKYYDIAEYSFFNDIVLAHLSDDNHLDIVVSDYQRDNVGVMLGHGNGTFARMVRHSTGYFSSPSSVAVDDINGDSILDIVTANLLTSSISILVGVGGGNFSDYVSVGLPYSNPRSIQIAHMNSDFYLDLIVALPSYDRIYILFGDTNHTYSRSLTLFLETDMYPYALNVDDYNRDSYRDIAVLNRNGNNIMVYLSNGNGSFPINSQFYLDSGSYLSDLLSKDFSGDGYADLLVSSYGYNRLELISISSQVDLIRKTTYSTGSAAHPIDVKLARMDNDPILDLVVANAGMNTIEMRRSKTNQTVSFSTGGESRPTSLVPGDFDLDGLEDVAVVNSWSNDIHVFLGANRSKAILPTGQFSTPTFVTSGFINDDDRLDLVVTNSKSGEVGIFFGWDCAQFNSHGIYIEDLSSKPSIIIVSDFNNDSYRDLLVAKESSDSISILVSDQKAGFGSEKTIEVSDDVIFLIMFDVDGDDRGDLILTLSDSTDITICLGGENGTFGDEQTFASGLWYPNFLLAGDFNGDNITDLLVSDLSYPDVAILLGFGDGSFAEPKLSSILEDTFTSIPIAIAAADLNRDGRTDVIAALPDAGQIAVGLTTVDGSIHNWTLYETGFFMYPSRIAVGHLNNDSHIDIAVGAYATASVMIFFGDGDGRVMRSMTIWTNTLGTANSILVSDINHDQIMDILISMESGSESGVYIYYGFGQEKFSLAQYHSTGTKSRALSTTIADVDSDNQLDLLVANGVGGNIFVLIQNELIPFTQQSPVFVGFDSKPIAVAVDDLDHDNKSDLIVIDSSTQSVLVALGNGDGTFQEWRSDGTDGTTIVSSMVVHDIDDDHHLDLILTYTATDQIAIWFGNGHGGWSNVTTCSLEVASKPTAVAVVDWNNTRQYDLVVTTAGSNAVLALEFHNRSCTSVSSFSLDFESDPRAVAIGDVNGDEMLDIVVASYGTNLVDVFLQTCEYDEEK